jgi:hypothetical protein
MLLALLLIRWGSLGGNARLCQEKRLRRERCANAGADTSVRRYCKGLMMQ